MKSLMSTLKKEIIKGGIVISSRRSGKSEDILSLLIYSSSIGII
jgi:hypothetical protein